jgi:hypothetical protein
VSNCNCEVEINAKLLLQLQETQPDAAQHRISLDGYSFSISENTIKSVPVMPIKGQYTVLSKKGIKQIKKISTTIEFNFCPFCGYCLSGKPPPPKE